MACRVILHTKTYDTATQKYVSVDKVIATIEKDQAINTDQVAEILAQLPQAERKSLAQQIAMASYTTLTDSMVKKHSFVSNCTPGELVSRFNLSADENIGSADSSENYTIIVVDNPASLYGYKLFGRVVAADGREMFVINSQQEARNFLSFVKARRNVNLVFGNGKTPPKKYESYLKDLDLIVKHKGKDATRTSVLHDYLVNKDAYTAFKVGGKVVNARYTLNMITRLLAGKEDYEPSRTTLELLIEQECEKGTNQKNTSEVQFWNISKEKLYKICAMYFPNFAKKTTLKAFTDMTQDEMQTFLYGDNGLFIGHAKLERGEVGKITSGDNGKIRIDFPYRVIGEIAYGKKFLYSPVNEGEIKNGMYHGFFVYKGIRDNGRTVYAISPSIISKDSYMWTESTAQNAMKEIDYIRSKRTIKLNSLLAVKQRTGNVRRAIIEQQNVRQGQVLSVLEIEGFPQNSLTLSDLPAAMSGLADLSIVKFQDALKNVIDTSKIDTTEKAAAFLIMTYQKLYVDAGKTFPDTLPEFIRDLANNSKDLKKLVIDPIAKAKYKHYKITELPSDSKEERENKKANPDTTRPYSNVATIVWLDNNGEGLDPTGQYVGKDSNGNPLKVETFLHQTLGAAAEYFRKKYKIKIYCMCEDEIKNLKIKDVNDKIDSVQSFIYKGNIYINTTRATEKNLYHEVVHIYLGVLRSAYPDGYKALMDHYRGVESESRKTSFDRMLGIVKKLYPGFALEDQWEEAVVRLIANELYRNNKLPRIEAGGTETAGFNEDLFQTLLNEVMEKTESLKGTVQSGDNGLGYTAWIEELMNNTGHLNKAKNQRIISQIIHRKIDNEEITPSADCKKI